MLLSVVIVLPVQAQNNANIAKQPDGTVIMPIDRDVFDRIWPWLKKQIGAPAELSPPRIVIDRSIAPARMETRYPCVQAPENKLEIGINPETLEREDNVVLVWAVSHELVHYLFLMRDNNYEWERKIFEPGSKHHCNREFMEITTQLAGEVWKIYHSGVSQMYQEVQNACAVNPGQ